MGFRANQAKYENGLYHWQFVLAKVAGSIVSWIDASVAEK